MNLIKNGLTVVAWFTTFSMLASCTNSKSSGKSENISSTYENGYNLIWSDEFDTDGMPDSSKWIYDTEGNSEGWGNREAQFYTEGVERNAYAKDGILHITAIKEPIGGKEYSSARLNSKAHWQYVRIEVRAKLPNGIGTWPAIWLMPGNWSFNDNNWPAVGEIDMMEHVGHERDVIHASAHSTDYQWKKGTQKTGVIKVPGVTENFHNYIFEWSHEVMNAYVDDSMYFEYHNEFLGDSKWPYDKPFFLILNVAVGGDWGGQQGIDENAFPQTMEIDYVRVYERKKD